jgi:hypothetical protein
MLAASTIWGIRMQFTVTYADGVWAFRVNSVDDEPEFLEEFEIDDESEAKLVVAELIEEIQELTDDAEVDDAFGIQHP